jgi:hypothetical protein
MNPYALAGIEVTPEQIISEWEKHFHMKLLEIILYDRHDDIAIPRHILCYTLYKFGSVSQDWIGGCIHRKRLTVRNSIETCKELLDTKEEGRIINEFIERIADISGNPNPKFAIEVKINREDLRILLPDADDWKMEHWSLRALWNLYQERKYTGKSTKKQLTQKKSKLTV